MATLPHISMRLHGGITAAQCIELGGAAERAGFAGLWFAENAFARGILPAAAVCAVTTKRLQINAGVFNPFNRHPAMMAMEIGALDELASGRAALGIGSGIASATAKIGMPADRPLAALRDTIAIVRGLLDGQEVDYQGAAFSARKVKLDYTPRRGIPIFIAARGNLAIKLAGEAGDGVIISNMCSAAFSGRIAAQMRESRRSAGRNGAGGVVQYMPCAVNRDAKAALDTAKRAVGEMIPGFWALGQKQSAAKEALLSGTGIDEREFSAAAARIAAGGDPADVLDERYPAAFSVFGTPADCLAMAAAYGEAGVTELALSFGGSSPIRDVQLLAEGLSGQPQSG